MNDSPRITTAEQAYDELVKLYPPHTPGLFARTSMERFPFEVGYRIHDGHHVRSVVVGRGSSWVAALDNAERRINRETRRKPRPKKPARGRALPQTDLFGGRS